ncbi:MAG: hypothetical protein SGPRY_001940 [Prymnesium sp.]
MSRLALLCVACGSHAKSDPLHDSLVARRAEKEKRVLALTRERVEAVRQRVVSGERGVGGKGVDPPSITPPLVGEGAYSLRKGMRLRAFSAHARLGVDSAALLSPALLIVGGAYVDEIHQLAKYPEEDTACRAMAIERKRGGNAANTSVVLSQLCSVASDLQVHWMGAISDTSQEDAAFVRDELNRAGVLTSHAEAVIDPAVSQPKVWPLSDLREGHGCALVVQYYMTPRLRWLHLECREMPSVGEMAKAAVEHRARASLRFPLSVEVEKPIFSPSVLRPLLRVADVVFFSREHIETVAPGLLPPTSPPPSNDHLALQTLQALSRLVEPRESIWICAWGSLGAFAYHTPSGAAAFEPAARVSNVVDTIGAGDTFIAAAIHAFVTLLKLESQKVACSSEQSVSTTPSLELAKVALRFACDVAADKISQRGFSGLGERHGGKVGRACTEA